MRCDALLLILGFTALVSVAANSHANGSNFFITTFSDGSHPDDVEASRNAKESRLADDDFGGNWGAASEGFQVSIRFDKQTFVVGEPIIATILLRNVSDQDLQYRDLIGLGRDFKLLVVNQQRKALVDTGHSRGRSLWRTLFKGTQHQVQVRLDDRFDLSAAGEYVVSAARIVPERGSRVVTEQLMTNSVATAEGGTRQELMKLRVPVYSDAYREVVSGNAIINVIGATEPAVLSFSPYLRKSHYRSFTAQK